MTLTLLTLRLGNEKKCPQNYADRVRPRSVLALVYPPQGPDRSRAPGRLHAHAALVHPCAAPFAIAGEEVEVKGASWRAVKLYGKRRSEKLTEQGHPNDLEVKLYNKMLAMEVSINNLSPLAPWHRPAKTRAIRFLIDGILLAAFVGSSYYLIGSMVEQVQEPEEENENEPTPIDELGFSPVELSESPNPFSPISDSPVGNSPAGNLDLELELDSANNPVERSFMEIIRQEHPEIIPTK